MRSEFSIRGGIEDEVHALVPFIIAYSTHGDILIMLLRYLLLGLFDCVLVFLDAVLDAGELRLDDLNLIIFFSKVDVESLDIVHLTLNYTNVLIILSQLFINIELWIWVGLLLFQLSNRLDSFFNLIDVL